MNKPIQAKLTRLVDFFHTVSFFGVVELFSKSSDVANNSIIPLGFKAFTHKALPSGRVYAMILVRHVDINKVKVVYDEAPFLLLQYRTEDCNVLVGVFYRPHEESVIYKSDLSKDQFWERLAEMTRECQKLPSIIND